MCLDAILSGAVGKVRKTDESPPRYAIIDIVCIVLGSPSSVAKNNWHRLQARGGLQNIEKAKFAGQGQRRTPICTAQQAKEIVEQMGGRAAAEFRATGETSKRKRAPKQEDLYIMKYSCDNSAVKIGRSDNVKRRKQELQAGHNFFMEVVAIFPGKGYLENEVHRNLQDFRSRRGAGREWFNICAADAAAICSNTLKELAEAGESSPTSHCRLLSKLADVDENDG